jgi:hypothetical protein
LKDVALLRELQWSCQLWPVGEEWASHNCNLFAAEMSKLS